MSWLSGFIPNLPKFPRSLCYTHLDVLEGYDAMRLWLVNSANCISMRIYYPQGELRVVQT